MQYIEVEKKYAVADPGPLKAKLAALGARPCPSTRQVDAYYNAPHRDFLAPPSVSEWLRIRTEEAGSSINFKRWHPIEAAVKTHAEEFESVVSDVEAVRRMLEALNFRPLVTVDKIREAWELPQIEVAFDSVTGLGEFVEFEFKGEADSPTQAIEKLMAFVASLDIELGDTVTRGYPHVLLDRMR